MSHPILVTGAAGGQQGSTGRHIANLLIEQGAEVRALVHKQDARSDGLRERGAKVVEGDLLDPPSVRSALQNVKRAFFTYPVADGLLEAATIFANAARDAGTELVVNNSQFQNRPEARVSAICSTGWPTAYSIGRRSALSTSRRRPIMRTCALWYRGAFLKKALSFYLGETGAQCFHW